MPYVYIGRRHSFIGHSLWEIIGHLKNFGVGRMVIRHRQKRYSEPCFMRIVSAEPKMDPDNLKGTVMVQKVFRGKNHGVVSMSRVAYKTDYQLIPKHEEYKYIKAYEDFKDKHHDETIYAPNAEMPPLLKLIAERKGHHATVFQFSLHPNTRRARIAKEGETPNAFATVSLGTPAHKKLYEDVLDTLPKENPAG